MAAATADLIRLTVERLVAQVPSLAKLKLVLGLELRGRGDVQVYRVEVPGPQISKGLAGDERLRISVARSHFNELATDGDVEHWREAYQHGHVKVEGDPKIKQLIGQVIDRQVARSGLKKTR